MYLSSNLQFLRKHSNGMTQEKLAQRMGVSRQTISKWESGEAYPELGNLMELCDIFSCKLDTLLRENLTAHTSSAVRIVQMESFRMARYIIISAQPEKDVISYVDTWARESGLLSCTDYLKKRIHWGFPYVSEEQKRRFGLQGHAAAYVLPEDFQPSCGGAEIVTQEKATYAVMTVQSDSPEYNSSSAIYPLIMEYLSNNGIGKCSKEGILPCFEREYWKGGIRCRDVFVHCESVQVEEKYRFE